MQPKDSTREQRKRQLGIDCPDKVVWKNWEAGEEYVKKIVIKNVDVRAQTISYRLPERKATFLTPYPEDTMLSSGMHMELEIRFCPTEVTEVNDCIEIKVKGRGSFVVCLEALPPHAKLSVPESYDFELCAVSKTYSHNVTVTNTGTVPLSFYWEAPQPFAIEPSHGELEKDESMEITLSFTPSDASASLCQAVCKMTDIEEVIATMKISGIGKYPFIRFQYHHRTEDDGPSKTGLLPVQADYAPLVPLDLTTSTISFGDVVAGSVLMSEFYVENPTSVPAELKVKRADDSMTGPFKVTPTAVTIPRGGCQKFKVTYKAMSGGSLHINRFKFTSSAGNTIYLETRGACVGPKVKCSTNSIEFGDINLDAGPSDKELTRVVQLNNMSNCVARYQFLNTAPGAAFAVEPCIGSIPSKGKVKVKIIFRPTHAMNYLRRLMILVHNSADALYMDVFGSAYDSFIRPLPFDLHQVEAFYMRLERGLGRTTPDELEALAMSATRDFPAEMEEESSAQAIYRSIAAELSGVEGKGLSSKRTGRLSYHHIFVEHNASAYPFKMDVSQVSFGGLQSTVQVVAVVNYTKSMAMASWCIPEGSVYSVTPLQKDLPPNGKADFTIRFNSSEERSSGPSAYDVGQYLECFVNFKQMRSFRLCCERSFTPPHCLTVQVNQDRGHSNDPTKVNNAGSAGSLLNADKSIFFPAVRIGDTAYQVLSIENSGDVVMTYENVQMILHEVSEKVADDLTVFETAPNRRTKVLGGQEALSAMYKANERAAGSMRSGGPNDIIFTCYPSKGILHPGQHTLMLLKFSPTRYARYSADASFRVANMSINDKLSVTMRGESHVPKIKLEELTQITFRPTCITGKTNRDLSIINPTCFPVSYQLVPSTELGETVRFHPSSGYLERGERVWVSATFCPEEPRVHTGSLSLVALDESDEARKIATDMGQDDQVLQEFVTTVGVLGEGMHGIIEVEPTLINCGDISGLEDQTVTITLYNSGMSPVQFEVRSMTRMLPKEWRHATMPPRLRNHTGVLPARSHTLVLVTVYPSAGLSEYILYVIVGGVGTNLNLVASPATLEEAQRHPHCQLAIKGTHPAIQIKDARSLSLRRSQLWCQLNINAINQKLSSPVIPPDVQNLGFAFPQNIHHLVPIAVDLGVGCRGSTPLNVSLLIQNTGDCAATFAFWLPMENDVSVEHWFQDDENLKDIQQLVDKSIIEINPSKGEVGVGKSMVVSFTYRFDTVGVHKLPVLLRVNDSKKVLLILEGRTLPEGMEALAFHHSSSYDLLPVALGDVEPPIQSVTIENPLEHEVTYRVDTEALRRVAEENFGFPILQCVNPSGVLAPHSVAQIAWYFRPLEAREYDMEVPISTGPGGEDYSITFSGIGFHPRKTSVETQREQLENAFLAIPSVPLLNLVPSLPVTLSVDALPLGAIPYFSLHRRVCEIENHHRHHIYSFQWDARHPTGDHVLSVVPLTGILRPGERLKCKITMYSGSTSQMIEWPLTCHITNETVLEQEAQPGALGAAEPQRNMTENADLHLAANRPPTTEVIAEHGAAVQRPPFHRTTCTKEYLAVRKKRKSVTSIPLESLGVRGLTARVKAERRRELEFAAAIEDEANDDRSIIYNSLELLLQARIMPIEDYERIYGNRSLNAMYMPVMNVFKDPRADVMGDALGEISKEDASLVRDIMDELLRSVVAHPRVKSAFTEPFIRDPFFYQDCAASRVQRRGRVLDADEITATAPPLAEDQKDLITKKSNLALRGFMNNVLEEALEELISNVVETQKHF